MTFRIKDWDIHFEKSDTRKCQEMRWIAVPNKQDGDGFTEMMSEENAVELYGAWMLIVQIASKCPVRGTLRRDTGEPHTAKSLSRITRVDSAAFERAFPILIRIGWLEVIDGQGNVVPSGKTGTPSGGTGLGETNSSRLQDRTIQDKTLTAPKQTGAGVPEEFGQRKPTPWGLWIDLHKARNLAVPLSLGQDTSASKQLAKAIPDLEELSRLMACYLDDSDAFLVKNSHNLRHMPGRVNTYRNAAAVSPPAAKLSPEFLDYVNDESKP